MKTEFLLLLTISDGVTEDKDVFDGAEAGGSIYCIEEGGDVFDRGAVEDEVGEEGKEVDDCTEVDGGADLNDCLEDGTMVNDDIIGARVAGVIRCGEM